MSVLAAQMGNAVSSLVPGTTVQASNGMVGTFTGSRVAINTSQISNANINGNHGISGTTLNIPNNQTIHSGTTIHIGGAGGTSGMPIGIAGGAQMYPPGSGGAGGTAAGGALVGSGLGWSGLPKMVTEDDLKNFVEFFSSLMSGFVLVSNETKDTKEVHPMAEGYLLFQTYKNAGDKVTVSMLNSEAAKVLYGKPTGP